MKAALFHGAKKPFQITEMADPELKEGYVIVRIKGAGICGGDLHRYSGGIKVEPLPHIMGHQIAGVVEKVGPGVPETIIPDMRVAILPFDSCGVCQNCRKGMDNLCLYLFQRWNLTENFYGGFAELVPVPYRCLVPIPESIPLVEAASLTDAVATPYHAIRLAGIQLGETAVVFGIGDLGSVVVQLARAQGARVIAVDVLEEKLKLAKMLGADITVNAARTNPVAQVQELTDGLGAQVAFEVAGRNDTTLAAIDCVRRGGRVILVGATDEPISEFRTMPYSKTGFALNRQLTLIAAWAMTSYEVQEVVNLRALGLINTEIGLSVLPLEEINEAFHHKAQGELTRVILVP